VVKWFALLTLATGLLTRCLQRPHVTAFLDRGSAWFCRRLDLPSSPESDEGSGRGGSSIGPRPKLWHSATAR
jgi:hypothetical protein